MTPYLDLAAFRVRTLMSVVEVDYVEQDSPGFVAARVLIRQSWIHQRLRKRYPLPFNPPIPEIILGWLTALVTLDTMRKRGFNPQDPHGALLVEDATRAEAEIKEAADSKEGLFDLGVTDDLGSAVLFGGPLGYSETSPYVWADIERAVGRSEDKAVTAITGSSSDE